MNWQVVMWFGIGLGVYLVGLGIFVLIKFLINKHKFKKEMREHGEEE